MAVCIKHSASRLISTQHPPLALMSEHHCAVVRIVLLDEDVTIEAAHVLDTEDTNRTERAGSYWDHLTLSDVSAELGVGS